MYFCILSGFFERCYLKQKINLCLRNSRHCDMAAEKMRRKAYRHGSYFIPLWNRLSLFLCITPNSSRNTMSISVFPAERITFKYSLGFYYDTHINFYVCVYVCVHIYVCVCAYLHSVYCLFVTS